MDATYYIIALIASIVVILLALFAFVMALFRFSKAKSSSDSQVQNGATKALLSGILSAIFIFAVGAGLLLVVFYYIAR
jgi:heme/copper-type cytochrome/quinol oxidase subunit 2